MDAAAQEQWLLSALAQLQLRKESFKKAGARSSQDSHPAQDPSGSQSGDSGVVPSTPARPSAGEREASLTQKKGEGPLSDAKAPGARKEQRTTRQVERKAAKKNEQAVRLQEEKDQISKHCPPGHKMQLLTAIQEGPKKNITTSNFAQGLSERGPIMGKFAMNQGLGADTPVNPPEGLVEEGWVMIPKSDAAAVPVPIRVAPLTEIHKTN